MPKKGKAGLKQKQKKKKDKKDESSNKKDDKEENNTGLDEEKNNINDDFSSMKRLMEKWDIRLGPKGYIAAPLGTPTSIDIEKFSMLDPGGGRQLLTNTEIHIVEGNHYGLVGKNGFGKTTLLKLMNEYEIEGFPCHIRMILVNQEELVSSHTVLECVLKADEVRERLLVEEERLTRIECETQAEDEDKDEEKINELSVLLEMIRNKQNDLSIDQCETRATQILRGLGFSQEMMKEETKNLSGGWQMRCKLAQALFVSPDLMLLDEPTNHLDFPTVLWLQDYLKNYKKTVIIVSHDRTFLNSVCNHTIHLTQKKLLYYKGNYDNMLKTANNELIEQIRKYDALKQNINEIKKWMQQNQHPGEKLAAQVQSKKKILEKLEDEAKLIQPPTVDKKLKFEFDNCDRLEDYICRMSKVSFKYPNMKDYLLNNISLQLDMDSRIGMIGANGVGKSTLVKLIMGNIKASKGDCFYNRHAKIALFSQYHMDQLNLEQNAIQFLCEKFAQDDEMKEQKDKVGYVRSRLGRFNLTGQQHTQPMKYLSGGQKSRVAFCVVTWNKPHFLIMDEPTNHLDMETIDSLLNAIELYKGGILVISHDQYFLEAATQQFWAVTPEKIRVFDDFQEAKSFALKSRMEQIGHVADQDEEKFVDINKRNYQKMKQQKLKEKQEKMIEKSKKGAKNKWKK